MVMGADAWADAPLIAYGSDSTPTPSAGLTLDLDEPFPPGLDGDLDRSAWWRLVAPASETVGLSTLDTITDPGEDDPDTVIAIWEGDTLDALTLVAWADDTPSIFGGPFGNLLTDTDFEAVAGTTYWIQVSSWTYAGNCQYALRVGKRVLSESDWIQDPNYLVIYDRDHLSHLDTTLGANDTASSALYETVGPTNVDARPFVLDAMSEILDGGPDGDIAALAAESGVSVAYGWDGGSFGGDDWNTKAQASIGFHPRAISPWLHDDTLPASDPLPGVYGWIWEPGGDTPPDDGGATSAVVSCVLDGSSLVITDSQDSSAPGAVLDGDFTTELRATHPTGSDFHSTLPGASSWPRPNDDRLTEWSPNFVLDPVLLDITGTSMPSGVTDQPLVDDIDLTGYLDDEGRVALYTRTTALIEPVDTSPPGFSGGEVVKYGWVLWDFTIHWTFRPRRYRWKVRSIELSSPYRCIFPRDDALAGGPGRNYPPSKAVQSSNLTSGYL